MKLGEKQWEKIKYQVPDGKGRHWKDKWAVLEGILWIVKAGARWKDLPKEYARCTVLIGTSG
jgi:transposase